MSMPIMITTFSEDLFILLQKVRSVYAFGDPEKELLPNEGLTAFMQHCSKKIGEAYFRTPRNTIKTFVGLLAVLEQNPEVSWRDLLGDIELPTEENPDLAPLENGEKEEEGDDLTSFQL